MTTPPNKKGLTHEFWEFAQVNTSWCTSVSAVGNSRRSPKRRDDCQKTQFAQVKWVHALQFQPLEILGVPLREATTIKRLNLLKWIWVDALQFVSAVGNSRRSPKRRDECQTTRFVVMCYTKGLYKWILKICSSEYESKHFKFIWVDALQSGPRLRPEILKSQHYVDWISKYRNELTFWEIFLDSNENSSTTY